MQETGWRSMGDGIEDKENGSNLPAVPVLPRLAFIAFDGGQSDTARGSCSLPFVPLPFYFSFATCFPPGTVVLFRAQQRSAGRPLKPKEGLGTV